MQEEGLRGIIKWAEKHCYTGVRNTQTGEIEERMVDIFIIPKLEELEKEIIGLAPTHKPHPFDGYNEGYIDACNDILGLEVEK